MLTKGNNLDLQLKVKQKWTDSITNDSNFKSTKEYLQTKLFTCESSLVSCCTNVTSLPNKVLTKFFIIMVKFDVR